MTAFEWEKRYNDDGDIMSMECMVLDRYEDHIYLSVFQTPAGHWDWTITRDGEVLETGREEDVIYAVSAAIETCFDVCFMR